MKKSISDIKRILRYYGMPEGVRVPHVEGSKMVALLSKNPDMFGFRYVIAHLYADRWAGGWVGLLVAVKREVRKIIKSVEDERKHS